jgi:hypothetical protein
LGGDVKRWHNLFQIVNRSLIRSLIV